MRLMDWARETGKTGETRELGKMEKLRGQGDLANSGNSNFSINISGAGKLYIPYVISDAQWLLNDCFIPFE